MNTPQITAVVQTPLLSPEACRAIADRTADLPWDQARLYDPDDPDARRSESCSLAEHAVAALGADTLARLLGCTRHFNRRCWAATLSGEVELNLLRYRPGDHFQRWHSDLSEEADTRKLGFTVQLSPADSYTGGLLEFIEHDEPSTRRQGDIILFPAFAVHRVTPIEQGVRLVLVGWLHGPRFH